MCAGLYFVSLVINGWIVNPCLKIMLSESRLLWKLISYERVACWQLLITSVDCLCSEFDRQVGQDPSTTFR